MKKTLILLAAFLISVGSWAQSQANEVEIFQGIFGMEKAAVVKEVVKIPEASNDAFWAVYDEYELKRKELGKQRIDLLNEYAEKYFELNDEVLGDMLKRSMKLNADYAKLINAYTKKVEKVTNRTASAQFYQFESYIMSLVRVILTENMPLVGELELE